MGFLQFILSYILRNQRTLLYTSLVLNFIVFVFILCLSLWEWEFYRKRYWKTAEQFSGVSDSYSSNPKNYLRIPFLNFKSKDIDEYNGYVIIGDFFFRFGAEGQVRQQLRLNGKRMGSGTNQVSDEMINLFNSVEKRTIKSVYDPRGSTIHESLMRLYQDAKKYQGRGWGYYGINTFIVYYGRDLKRKLDRLIELMESRDEAQTVIEKEFARNWLGGLAYHSVLENGSERNEQIWVEENGKVHCSTTSSCLWIIWGKITANEIRTLSESEDDEKERINDYGWADTYSTI